MERLALCRICFNENVSQLKLDTQLQEVYENLTLMPFQNATKSTLICYICRAQLYRAHRLKLQCLKADKCLTQKHNRIANKDGMKEDSIEIETTEVTRLICSTVQHIHIEPLANVNKIIPIKYHEDVTDIKIEIKCEDISEPDVDLHQASNHSDVDNEQTCIDLIESEDTIPLNCIKEETESVSDRQNRVGNKELVGWKKGASITKKSARETQNYKNVVSESNDNIDSIKNAIMHHDEVTRSKCNIETRTSIFGNNVTEKEKYNKHTVDKSDTKYCAWSNASEFQCNNECIMETLLVHESNLSKKERDNKNYVNLIISNKTVSDAAAIKNSDENVTTEYSCEKEFVMNNLKQYKIPQNKRNSKNTKDSNLVTHSGNKRQFICEICWRNCKNSRELKRHVRLHTGEKPYSCKICDKRFAEMGQLKIHERLHTGERPYSCKICDKRFTRIGSLKTHEHVHTGKRPYSCKMCDKSFTRIDNLKTHERIHTGERPYICEICDKTFTSTGNIKRHKCILSDERSYSCNICDKRFAEIGNLKIHERIHTGERPYICTLCDKRFTRIKCLRTHVRIHTGERPYSCKICDKRFTQIGNLKTHELLHTGEKPYSCKICDKRFMRIDYLKIHELTHTGERRFSCKICDKRFPRLYNLKTHIRVHTGERPYSCKICEKRFSEVSNLKRHERTHTGKGSKPV